MAKKKKRNIHAASTDVNTYRQSCIATPPPTLLTLTKRLEKIKKNNSIHTHARNYTHSYKIMLSFILYLVFKELSCKPFSIQFYSCFICLFACLLLLLLLLLLALNAYGVCVRRQLSFGSKRITQCSSTIHLSHTNNFRSSSYVPRLDGRLCVVHCISNQAIPTPNKKKLRQIENGKII